MGEERELPFGLSDDERLVVAAWTEPASWPSPTGGSMVASASHGARPAHPAIRRIQLDVEVGPTCDAGARAPSAAVSAPGARGAPRGAGRGHACRGPPGPPSPGARLRCRQQGRGTRSDIDPPPRDEPELKISIDGSVVAVSDGRGIVASGPRTVDLLLEHLRRVTLTVEVGRPAMLMIVPRDAGEAISLSVPASELGDAARLVLLVAGRLARLSGAD